MEILNTKITAPQATTNLVLRQRLMDKFDRIPARKITTVTAPAGSGKTTSITNWIGERGLKTTVAWVSLAEKENDPVRFWSYVVSSLGSLVNLDFADWLSEIRQYSQIDLDSLLINLTDQINDDLILVLDDFHHIQSEPVMESLAYFVDYFPQRLHLVISSRTHPSLPIEQYRVHDQLLEITLADLRFSEQETDEYFRKTVGIALAADDLSQITLKTEGWIAGLQLAALSIQGKSSADVSRFVETFSGTHYHVDNFLTEQVVHSLPENVREFLLVTSILTRFSPALCDALSGREDGMATIRWLEKNNLFLVRLDPNQQWYRYHALFGEFLQEKLTTSSAIDKQVLYQNAAIWCEQHSLLEEAVQYSLDAGNHKLAARLVSQTAQALWNRSDVNKMKGWLSKLPETILLTRPYLFFSFAWATGFTARFLEMGDYIRRAREYFNDPELSLMEVYADVELNSEDEWMLSPQGVEVSLNMVSMFYDHFMGNVSQAVNLGIHLVKKIPVQYVRLRGIAHSLLGRAFLASHNLGGAVIELTSASEANRLSGYDSAYMESSSQLAATHLIGGKLNRAFEILNQASMHVNVLEEPVLSGADMIGKGNLYREWNDLEKAEKFINDGLTLAKAGGDFVFLNEAYLAKVRLEYSKGNFDAAIENIQKAERLFINSPSCVENSLVHSWALRVWLAKAELRKAKYWIANPKFIPDSLPSIYREFFMITKARVLMADAKPTEAKSLLDELLYSAESGGRINTAIEIHILMALVCDNDGSSSEALTHLYKAIGFAQPEGYARIFLDEGSEVLSLLKKTLRRYQRQPEISHLRDYVSGLVNSFRQSKKTATIALHTRAMDQPLIDPLSERELEILSMMAEGIPYERIANELVVALSTVRWHVKNIFRKLNAHSGMEAVALARELGVFS